MSDPVCTATLRHAHGVTRCEEPAGHEGKHVGPCYLCWEDGDYPWLIWDGGPGLTEWPI